MRWYEMKGQPNRDSNPVPPSQETNHATNWANEAGCQVQRSFIFKMEEDQDSVGAKVKIQAASYVKDQVIEVYERADIMTISQRKFFSENSWFSW